MGDKRIRIKPRSSHLDPAERGYLVAGDVSEPQAEIVKPWVGAWAGVRSAADVFERPGRGW